MSRLIDADALFNWGKYKLSDAVKYGNKNKKQRDWSYSTLMMYEIAYEIDNAPAADVVPVEKYMSLRNFACQLCGKYKYAHDGACGDCRWKAKEGDNAE